MLILSRKLKESIRIGDNIEIKVLEIIGDQVKLGIDAPKAIDIHRSEVYMQIQMENNEAANLPAHVLSTLPGKDVK
ncbi:carbon storage regulator CsrA [Lentibacillus saliphilus]|uniref:carbon storage regulator CsrA n=1 Tax=Lentibacillus saliphilus TaxID=2737028 RepID=UPI001C2FE812|nr:carbon storage regulator CsrA [Lentibacillus saliphilus]